MKTDDAIKISLDALAIYPKAKLSMMKEKIGRECICRFLHNLLIAHFNNKIPENMIPVVSALTSNVFANDRAIMMQLKDVERVLSMMDVDPISDNRRLIEMYVNYQDNQKEIAENEKQSRERREMVEKVKLEEDERRKLESKSVCVDMLQKMCEIIKQNNNTWCPYGCGDQQCLILGDYTGDLLDPSVSNEKIIEKLLQVLKVRDDYLRILS